MMLLRLLSGRSAEFAPIVVSLKNPGPVGPRIEATGVPVYGLGLRHALANPFGALPLMRLVRRFRPALIQGWMPHGNIMAMLAGLFSPNPVPVLWNIRMSLHGLSAERMRTRALVRFSGRLSSYPQAIIYNSRVGAQQHEALGYDPGRKVVIPNGFDCDEFHPDAEARCLIRRQFGIADEAVLVGLIARYDPLKDHAGFFRAAALVSKVHPEVRFLLAGRGVSMEQPELAKLAEEHQLQGRTLLLGERTDIPGLTAALDIACSSSWAEGFSNSIGEAMACAVPCVVTDSGDSAYIVGETGLVVPARNSDALGQAICQLIEAGPAVRRGLGEAARRRVEGEFSLSAIARRYEDLYRGSLKQPQGLEPPVRA